MYTTCSSTVLGALNGSPATPSTHTLVASAGVGGTFLQPHPLLLLHLCPPLLVLEDSIGTITAPFPVILRAEVVDKDTALPVAVHLL